MNKLKIFLAVAIVMLIASCNDKKQKPQMIADDEVGLTLLYTACAAVAHQCTHWNSLLMPVTR